MDIYGRIAISNSIIDFYIENHKTHGLLLNEKNELETYKKNIFLKLVKKNTKHRFPPVFEFIANKKINFNYHNKSIDFFKLLEEKRIKFNSKYSNKIDNAIISDHLTKSKILEDLAINNVLSNSSLVGLILAYTGDLPEKYCLVNKKFEYVCKEGYSHLEILGIFNKGTGLLTKLIKKIKKNIDKLDLSEMNKSRLIIHDLWKELNERVTKANGVIFVQDYKNQQTIIKKLDLFKQCTFKCDWIADIEVTNFYDLLWYEATSLIPSANEELLFRNPPVDRTKCMTNLYANTIRHILQSSPVINQITYLKLRSHPIEIIPKEIKFFENLTVLDFALNKLKQFSNEISLLNKLERIDLSCNLFEKIPKGIFQLKNLEYLNFAKNKLTVISGQIGLLKKLKGLDFSQNQLSEIPTEINQLLNLEKCSFGLNKLTKIGPLYQLSNRCHIALKGNLFTKEVIEELKIKNHPGSGPLFNLEMARFQGCAL